MAAIQGLYQIVQERDVQIATLEQRLATVEQAAPGSAPTLPTWLLALAAGTLLALLGVALLGMLVLARLRRTEAL